MKLYNLRRMALSVLTVLSISGAYLVLADSPKDLKYLSQFNLKWDRAPEKWSAGAFCGNGRLGTTVWGDHAGGVRFDIGDTYIYKDKSRIPIGKFTMTPSEKVSNFTMTQSLINSEINGKLTTASGEILFSCFIDMNHDAGHVRILSKGNVGFKFDHIPIPGAPAPKINSVKEHIYDLTAPNVYDKMMALKSVKNLPPEKVGKIDGINYRKVPFNATTGYILTWKVAQNSKTGTLDWTTYVYNSKDKSNPEIAVKKLKDILTIQFNQVLAEHRRNWHKYFEGSYISIPDKKVEANYWIQIYKMRAAARPGSVPIDLLGPWYRYTPWPRIWCNLNIQVTYPVMTQAGKYDVARTLFDYMDLKNQHFIKAVGAEYQSDSAAVGRGWAPFSGTGFWGEYGNFLWMLYDYSQFLAYFPDEKRQKEKYYPLLKRGINFVIHKLKKDDQGIYHIPADVSPEYKTDKGIPKIKDNNYNIGTLTWALDKAIYLAKKFNDKSPVIEQYKEVRAHLVPLQIDPDTGIMVGKDYTMDFRHRHFSHLLALYPLAVVDVNTPEGYALAKKSVERWLSRPKWGWGYKGYTYGAAAAMYSRLSMPEKALENIHIYLNKFATPNTFYMEAGPVIETTMLSASATLEMLIQSFNRNHEFDEIRVFTSIPTEWKDVSISELPSIGGHLTSAVMKGGKIVGIKVVGGSDRLVKILYPASAKLKTDKIGNRTIKQSLQGKFNLVSAKLKKGEILIIGQKLPSNGRCPVSGKAYHFGVNKK